MFISKINDNLTTTVLNVIREFESENNVNVDVQITYGKYANSVVIDSKEFSVDYETVLYDLLCSIQKYLRECYK